MATIITISNLTDGKFFFTTDHCQKHNLGEEWVPCTYSIPMQVSPRKTLPSGLVTNKEELIIVFYDDMEEIKNPNSEYQA